MRAAHASAPINILAQTAKSSSAVRWVAASSSHLIKSSFDNLYALASEAFEEDVEYTIFV